MPSSQRDSLTTHTRCARTLCSSRCRRRLQHCVRSRVQCVDSSQMLSSPPHARRRNRFFFFFSFSKRYKLATRSHAGGQCVLVTVVGTQRGGKARQLLLLRRISLTVVAQRTVDVAQSAALASNGGVWRGPHARSANDGPVAVGAQAPAQSRPQSRAVRRCSPAVFRRKRLSGRVAAWTPRVLTRQTFLNGTIGRSRPWRC